MSVSLPEFFRKTTINSQETSKRSSSEEIPDRSFQELLQVHPTDEQSREKSLFSLIEEEEEEKIIDGLTCIQNSLSSSLSLEQKKEQMESIGSVAYNPALLFPSSSSVNPSAAAGSILASEIEAIFEKMASSMIVMNLSGEVETTLFLDNPSSIFFGTKITIREFSTAPRAFNVEIAGFTSAIHVIESSKNNLLSAFQNGKFNFSIHRLETYIQREDQPVFHRKENPDRDSQERKGGREE